MSSNPLAHLTPLELARLSPAGFAQYASGGEWQLAKHLTYLNSLLMQMAQRRIRRLMVSMPPRHGKSELLSKYLPTWVTGALRQKVIFTAYSADFASEFGVYARDLMTEHGPKVFDTKVRSTMSYASHWETESGGVMYTVGAGGAITGRGCDWLIIDDPVKNDEEANSAAMRAKTLSWFRSTARTRLEPNAVIIIVMTRWHDEDLIGSLLRSNPDQWTVVRFPAIAEGPDILGRQAGDPLWPERWPMSEYLALRNEMEPHEWESLYQQNPVILGGNKVKTDWWQYYQHTAPPKFDRTYIVWDAATSAKESSDYSVAAVISAGPDGLYWREVIRRRVEFPELVKWAHSLNAKYPRALNVVEDASAGRALIQVLREETKYPVVPQTVHTDKLTRLNNVMHYIEGGKCHLPEGAPWLRDFLDEHNRFPATTYKDQVDTTSLALKYVMESSSEYLLPKRKHLERDTPAFYLPDRATYRDLLDPNTLEV